MKNLAKLLMLLTLSAQSAWAEVVYVTDSVTVGLFTSPDLSGEPIDRIISGTPLEVQETQEGVAKVKTNKGTEGWVRQNFLTSSVPAIIKVGQLNEELNDLKDDLKAAEKKAEQLEDAAKDAGSAGRLRNDLDKARKQIADLEAQLKAKPAKSEGGEDIEQLKAEKADLEMRLAASNLIYGVEDEDAVRIPLAPFFVSLLIVGGLGFWGGYAWIDVRLRRRFGGIRIH